MGMKQQREDSVMCGKGEWLAQCAQLSGERCRPYTKNRSAGVLG